MLGKAHPRFGQVVLRPLEDVRRAAERSHHAGKTLRRRARVEGACGRTGRAGLLLGQPTQHQELGGERESDFAQTEWTARPVNTSIASRTSRAFPAVRPRHWLMSVSNAEQRSPAPFATSTSVRASSRVASNDGRNAPDPALTSMTRASRPAASFLDKIEATISEIDSTVAVTSRMA